MRSRLLSLSNINPHLIQTKYAVRGEIPTRAAEIQQEINSPGSNYPFSSLSQLNIGNPQFFEFSKIESTRIIMSHFLRRFSPHLSCVSSGYLSSELQAEVDFLADEYARVLGIHSYAQNLDSGVPGQSVARFIQKRDGYASNPEHIFSGNGASETINTILNLLIDGPSTGIMCSVPTYPLYSALIRLYNGSFVKYYLDEDDNWNINVSELERSYQEAKKQGITPKALVLINPGNPTGNIFDLERMREIVEFCYRRNLVVLADEVYQENVYSEEKQFHSFKKVLNEADSNIRDNLELVSFHTISKGYLGECGLRGGYMELVNIDPQMVQTIANQSRLTKPNLMGDLCLDLKSRYLSGELTDLKNLQSFFDAQVSEKVLEFKERAEMVEQALNNCEGVRTNPIDGAMYAFPRLYLPQKFVKKAEEQNRIPDFHFCMKMLESTGLCTVPGSGFGQVDGTFHLRTTILPSPNGRLADIMEKFKEFNNRVHSDYS